VKLHVPWAPAEAFGTGSNPFAAAMSVLVTFGLVAFMLTIGIKIMYLLMFVLAGPFLMIIGLWFLLWGALLHNGNTALHGVVYLPLGFLITIAVLTVAKRGSYWWSSHPRIGWVSGYALATAAVAALYFGLGYVQTHRVVDRAVAAITHHAASTPIEHHAPHR